MATYWLWSTYARSIPLNRSGSTVIFGAPKTATTFEWSGKRRIDRNRCCLFVIFQLCWAFSSAPSLLALALVRLHPLRDSKRLLLLFSDFIDDSNLFPCFRDANFFFGTGNVCNVDISREKNVNFSPQGREVLHKRKSIPTHPSRTMGRNRIFSPSSASISGVDFFPRSARANIFKFNLYIAKLHLFSNLVSIVPPVPHSDS